jgi:low temperature requirement protein LtrA
MPAVFRWQPPKLRAKEAAGEAKVTSVDLFYDLIFAVVVAQLVTGLSENLTPYGFLVFALLFVAVVRVWSSETFYSDRFEAIDVSYRIEVFLAMVPAGGMAVAAPDGLGRLFPLFALSIAAAHAVLIGQWLRAGRHEPQAQALARRYTWLYSTIAILWVVAAFSPFAVRLALAIVAVLVDLSSPFVATHLQADLGHFDYEHLSDRFGAFFLLMLGQVVLVGVLVMTRMRQPSFADLTTGVLSFAITFELWWTYVDHVVGRTLRRDLRWNAFWTYMNIPLFLAAGTFGSATLTFVTRGEQVVPDGVRWMLAGSIATVMLFAGIAEIALEPLPPSGRRLGTSMSWVRSGYIHALPALLALLVGALGHGLPVIPLLSELIVVGLVSVLLGEYPRAL